MAFILSIPTWLPGGPESVYDTGLKYGTAYFLAVVSSIISVIAFARWQGKPVGTGIHWWLLPVALFAVVIAVVYAVVVL